MKQKLTLPEAKEIAERLKKKFKFDKSTRPAWFGGVSIMMEQDGNYCIGICIPSWNSISEADSNQFLEPFLGARVILRVVSVAKPYVKKETDAKK